MVLILIIKYDYFRHSLHSANYWVKGSPKQCLFFYRKIFKLLNNARLSKLLGSRGRLRECFKSSYITFEENIHSIWEWLLAAFWTLI